MNKKQNLEKGNRFTSTNQPAHNGRKPKIYTIAKGFNIGYDDFKEVCMWLMSLNKKEIEKVANSDKTPIWIVNIARAMHKDTGKGTINTLRELADRFYGKAMQQVDVTSKGEQVNVGEKYSIEETIEIIGKLKEKYNNV